MLLNNELLRNRVRLLGSFLGEAISRQSGKDTVDTIEILRSGFIQERRQHNAKNKQQLIELIASLDNQTLKNVIRAFSIYFFRVYSSSSVDQTMIYKEFCLHIQLYEHPTITPIRD